MKDQPFTTKDLSYTNVLLVDYNNLAMRAFFGSRTLTAPDGRPCNAVFAMLRMTRVILESYRTFAVVMVCDDGFPEFRMTLTKRWGPGYKTSRKKNPQPGIEDARKQREWAKDLLKWLGVVFVSAQQFEADDTIAWCVHRLAQTPSTPPYRSLIWSNDKDLRQLVGRSAAVIQSGEGESHLLEERDPYMLLRRAVVGDKSDDVVGIRGIADKKFDALVADMPPVSGRPSHNEFLSLVEKTTPSSKTAETVRAAILADRQRILDNMTVSDLRVTYQRAGERVSVSGPFFSPDLFRKAALNEWGFNSIARAQDAFSEFVRPYAAVWQRKRVGSVASEIQGVPF